MRERPSVATTVQEKLIELQTSPSFIEIKLQDSQIGLGTVVLTDREIETVATFKGAASVNIPLAAAKGLQIKGAGAALTAR